MATLPLQISQASGVPFYRQVHDQVHELIAGGQLTPGERLPSVRDLAKTLLVSLITVRRAYADLEAAGLIVRRQGQGTFVAETARSVPDASREQAADQLVSSVQKALRVGIEATAVTTLVTKTLEAHDA
ncbi:MAG: GntR family transcriptional regulator [Proteobacteria bacterium]|nr:GntR family transcriptional regulator [Pseudomonadota bacterium]MCP4917175.1 GntR family transcriptional regulator [Pseudomonadota bacterium]